MSKVQLTRQMADTLRDLRLQNKIASKRIAAEINRSPSYISKIESGTIKSISSDELDVILCILFPACSSKEERFDSLLKVQIDKYDYKIREEDVWFCNLDTVYSLLPLPKSLITEINEIMDVNHVSVDTLVRKINLNEELCNEDLNNKDLPVNEWFCNSSNPSQISIKIEISTDRVNDILEGKVEKTNYVTIQAIVHYLYKIIYLADKEIITDDDLIALHTQWQELLDKHKFYSMSRKEMLLSQSKSDEQANSILNEFDIRSRAMINEIIRYFKAASNLDIISSNKSFSQLIENMKWDIGFTIKLIGFNFSSLGDCSFTNRSSLLKEIKSLIEKYKNMDQDQKQLNIYDDIDQ